MSGSNSGENDRRGLKMANEQTSSQRLVKNHKNDKQTEE